MRRQTSDTGQLERGRATALSLEPPASVPWGRKGAPRPANGLLLERSGPFSRSAVWAAPWWWSPWHACLAVVPVLGVQGCKPPVRPQSCDRAVSPVRGHQTQAPDRTGSFLLVNPGSGVQPRKRAPARKKREGPTKKTNRAGAGAGSGERGHGAYLLSQRSRSSQVSGPKTPRRLEWKQRSRLLHVKPARSRGRWVWALQPFRSPSQFC